MTPAEQAQNVRDFEQAAIGRCPAWVEAKAAFVAVQMHARRWFSQ